MSGFELTVWFSLYFTFTVLRDSVTWKEYGQEYDIIISC